MKCSICSDKIYVDHPNTIFGVNPITFRQCVMHLWCFVQEYEELADKGARNPIKFANRKDEYDQFIQS